MIGRTDQVAGLLGRATNPVHPEEVAVSRPSEALTARLAVTGGSTVLLLGAAGGMAGVMLGAAVTYGLATVRGRQTLVPAPADGAALVLAVVIGGCAGLYPAMRAARLSPTEALGAM